MEGKLDRIQARLKQSVSFPYDYPGDKLEEDVTTFARELSQFYDSVVATVIEQLGSPIFAGKYGSDGYPEGEIAGMLTCWHVEHARVQVEYDQPSPTDPFVVSISAQALT